MKLVIFYSIVKFSYTEYFVHSYTIDVVFTFLLYDSKIVFQIINVSF